MDGCEKEKMHRKPKRENSTSMITRQQTTRQQQQQHRYLSMTPGPQHQPERTIGVINFDGPDKRHEEVGSVEKLIYGVASFVRSKLDHPDIVVGSELPSIKAASDFCAAITNTHTYNHMAARVSSGTTDVVGIFWNTNKFEMVSFHNGDFELSTQNRFMSIRLRDKSSGKTTIVYGVHLRHKANNDAKEMSLKKVRQSVEALVKVATQANDDLIIAGDFNYNLDASNPLFTVSSCDVPVLQKAKSHFSQMETTVAKNKIDNIVTNKVCLERSVIPFTTRDGTHLLSHHPLKAILK
eukprot:m.71170 g.71170  ORF g.71170 m.71170 type:complete len:295 (+) comp8338_c3_seq7:4668-5552(+)